MVLELPCFDSDCGLDHFEVFAGDMAVTTAELKDSCCWAGFKQSRLYMFGKSMAPARQIVVLLHMMYGVTVRVKIYSIPLGFSTQLHNAADCRWVLERFLLRSAHHGFSCD